MSLDQVRRWVARDVHLTVLALAVVLALVVVALVDWLAA